MWRRRKILRVAFRVEKDASPTASSSGSLPCLQASPCKADKLALRKRAKFFIAKDCELYYVGGATKTSKKPVQCQ